MPDRVGEQFGEYRLTRKLGGGTFGDVYLGEHTKDNTPAAIKVLQARLNNSEDLKDYINEIRTLFRLQHPNIVPLLDFGIERDIPFLVMAYAPNGTLRQPKGTRLPLDTVVSYIKQIAEALQCAHDRKLIHRDVKPDNILLGPNSQVWLSDFGIASIAQSSRSLKTQDGAGTIPYMAPEQILGKPRLASDQYALGIIAYEWICGSRPFNGTYLELVAQHTQAVPPPLRNKVPTLTTAIEQVVLKALAKDPKDRFGSVREFAEALALAVERSKPRSALPGLRAFGEATATYTAAAQRYKPRPVPQKTKEQCVDDGIAFYDAGKYKEAIEAYNNAIRLDPNYAIAYNNRGNTYDDLKEYAKAIEDYNRAIDLNPRLAEAYFNRGNTYRDLKEYTKAIEDYNRAIDLNPRYAYAYYGRGLIYYYLNDYQRAIQDFDYALQLDPGITWFQSAREDAYRKLGRNS